jgi:hypothetical protein
VEAPVGEVESPAATPSRTRAEFERLRDHASMRLHRRFALWTLGGDQPVFELHLNCVGADRY